MKKLSQKLHYYFFEEERPEEVKLGAVFALAEERLFGFPLAFIAFFGMFPIPGVSAIFGTLMLTITLQLCLGRTKPWVPQKMLNRTISLTKLQSLMRHLIPWLERFENFTKPRLIFVCHSFIGRIIMGSILSLMAFIVFLPIPAANTIPSFGIFVAALGLQEDDGVLGILGLLISLAFAVFLAGIIWTGNNLFEIVKVWLLTHIF
jgi:hypothetical protein